MKIIKLCDSTIKEDDIVSASFNNKTYRGIVKSVYESDIYIEFYDFDSLTSLYEKYSENEQYDKSNAVIDILDWMERPFSINEIKLESVGERWDEKEWTYDLNKKEEFYLFSRTYDVMKAMRLLYKHQRPTIKFDPLSVRSYIRDGSINVSDSIAKNANLNTPIILASHNGSSFPIDGWHRIKKALDNNVKLLDAYLLTEEETKEIMD